MAEKRGNAPNPPRLRAAGFPRRNTLRSLHLKHWHFAARQEQEIARYQICVQQSKSALSQEFPDLLRF